MQWCWRWVYLNEHIEMVSAMESKNNGCISNLFVLWHEHQVGAPQTTVILSVSLTPLQKCCISPHLPLSLLSHCMYKNTFKSKICRTWICHTNKYKDYLLASHFQDSHNSNDSLLRTYEATYKIGGVTSTGYFKRSSYQHVWTLVGIAIVCMYLC